MVRDGQLKNELAAIFNVLKAHRRAIDIGANIGIYSLAFSKRFSYVEAFEPNASCTPMLEDLAKVKSSVVIHHNGLSDSNMFSELYVPLDPQSLTEALALASVNDPGGSRKKYTISLKNSMTMISKMLT